MREKGDQSGVKNFLNNKHPCRSQNCSVGRQLRESSSPSENFFPGILFFLGVGRAQRVESSFSLSSSCFLFGFLTRPPTPFGFEEHPEDIY